MLYTQCPQCQYLQTVSTEQLRLSRGMSKCKKCSTLFDVLEFISEHPLEEAEDIDDPKSLSSARKQNIPLHVLWLYGFFAGILLLASQIYFFEGYALSQNRILRPWLLKLCQTLDCRLPEYKNINEVRILQGGLQATDKHSYEFKAVISNQARFSQLYPDIQLTLLTFTGEAFAERVFSAHNYRPESALLAADEIAEISFEIAAPQTGIGGYTFKLL